MPALDGDSDSDFVAVAELEVERLAEALREPLRVLLDVALPERDCVAMGEDETLELRDMLGVTVAETLADGVPVTERVTVTLADTLAVMLALVVELAIVDGDSEVELPNDIDGETEAARLVETDALRLRLGDAVALGEAEPRNREMARSRLLPASVA